MAKGTIFTRIDGLEAEFREMRRAMEKLAEADEKRREALVTERRSDRRAIWAAAALMIAALVSATVVLMTQVSA